MRTFAQKPKAIQQITPAKSAIFSRAHFGQHRDLNSILKLQRTIGNQAVQRLLRVNKGDVKRESIPEIAGFGNVFSRTPLRSPAPGAIQTKLSVNKPGDQYQQEADRISEQVMRMPEPRLQRTRTCGGACPKCQAEQLGHGHERLQTRHVGTGDGGQTEVPPLVHEVLRSPGQPIDPATRVFMELRFGRDFRRVRVHHDEKAAESAKSISALAYTSGNHIAFNDGQYSPTTESGKQLLAHELVHTMQQGNNSLHRKIDFTQPQPILSDPIPSVLGGRTILGRTLPGFNGTLLPEFAIKKDYKEAVFKVLQPQTFNFSVAQNNEKTCKVAADNFNINVFAEVRAITQPQGKKWSGSYPPGILGSPPSACANKSKNDAIQVEMEGKPDSTALHKKVLTHEREHVTDLEKISTSELKPYHDFLIGITGKGKTNEECVNDIFKQVGNRDALAANEFVEKWLNAVQVYDKPGGTHHSKFETKVDPQCTTMNITEKV
jgi:Domain of unknown function (DUF4157)